MDLALQAQVGAQVEFSLPAYATAGYRWQVVETPDGVKVAEKPRRPAQGAPGDPSEQVFEAAPDRPGEFEVRLVLKRPWESQPTDTAVVRITAR